MQTFALTIDGRRCYGEAGRIPVLDPCSARAFAECEMASPAQLDAAVAAAVHAFQSWRRTPLAERAEALNAIADLIERHAEELARLTVQEQGKPLALAMMEVGGAAAWTRATATLELPSKLIEDSPERRIVLLRQPIGVVGSITPWNWPLLIASWHVMPALLAGNAVVIKPSTMTPCGTLRLVELMNQVLPAGVINAVSGNSAIGRGITGHPGIGKLVFTGSTATGQEIMRNAAGNLKRLTLELGGNDAGIVLPDADVDRLAERIFASAFLNMGQTCAALKRLYVHESLHDALCDRLVALAREQVLGCGLEEDVTFGPLQNASQLEYVHELVEDARAGGARVLTGGALIDGPGYFYPPTIVSEISDGSRLVDEEQFGPALPVIRYRDIDDAIARANANPNGLGGSLWTGNLDLARSLAPRLECGTVWINNHAEVLPHCPFGGCKMSGFGVEFGIEGLHEFTRPQAVSVNLG